MLTSRLDDLVASLYRSVDREETDAIEFQWDKAGKLAAGTMIRIGFSFIPVLGGIAKAVEKAGEGLGEEAYADKVLICFITRRLPSIPGLSNDDAQQVADLMATGLLRNPRKVKRTFNSSIAATQL